ncbi:hypothetical protein ACFVVA_36870 [Kitasatospora sp. NPDC058048]|uniref:hypothetical protein n=1 Tax=Kitasatospora sp. NPDC058048 TaxID=3346313 RepID=UPI0036DD3628
MNTARTWWTATCSHLLLSRPGRLVYDPLRTAAWRWHYYGDPIRAMGRIEEHAARRARGIPHQHHPAGHRRTPLCQVCEPREEHQRDNSNERKRS